MTTAAELRDMVDDELFNRLAAMKLPVRSKFVTREGDLFEGQ